MNKEFYENISIGTNLFGRFLLLDIISSSDTGAVYKCQATWGEHRGKIVALKVTESRNNPAYTQEQLIREIKILSKITHPNIIQAYDWFEDEIFLAYSMEYVEGGTLDRILQHSPEFSISWSVNLLSQLALGLREIHRHGIIHRDIKPQNLLVTANNQLKIADFGIAVRRNSSKSEDTEQITGTIDFVSPEYIRSGTYDHRSDIYAWGVLAYLMLTGHVPFEDASIVDALTRKATEDPISPRSHRLDIPESLCHLILHALTRNPEDRIQSCDELLSSLEGCAKSPRATSGISGPARLQLIKRVA